MKYLIVLIAFIGMTGLASAQDAASIDHEAEVRAAVLAYFEAGNTGDPDLAREAFETENGVMFIQRPGEDGDQIQTMNLGDFADRFTRAQEGREGEIIEVKLINDEMAFAHFLFTTPDRTFNDFFLLYRLDDEWKIVSKAFTVE